MYLNFTHKKMYLNFTITNWETKFYIKIPPNDRLRECKKDTTINVRLVEVITYFDLLIMCLRFEL